MSKVMQIYGLTVSDVSRLSNGQIAFLLEEAETTAMLLLRTNNEFQQSMGDRLSPVKKAVRAALQDRPFVDVSASSSTAPTATEGGPIGRPPAI